MTSENYSNENIKHVQDLDYIKLRSTAYIQDISINGHYQLIKELIDNSIDELEEIKIKNGAIDIFLINLKDTYNIIVMDNGRGIPIDRLKNAFTELHTSGKFDTNSYSFSAGTFGVGATATVALSSHFRALTFRKKKFGELIVTNGKNIINDQYQNTIGIDHGTIVLFEPNKEILKDENDFKQFGYKQIISFLEILSLFAEFKIRFFIINNNRLNLWNIDAATLVNRINQFSETIPIFCNENFNREQFIINSFKKYEWNYNLKYSSSDLLFDIEVYANTNIQINQSSNKITMVNNIPFFDNGNIHIRLFIQEIKKFLAKKYQEAAMKDFIINEYKLPISFLMNIKFKGAQFSGTIKHLFRDVNFKIPFINALHYTFDNTSFIESLHEYIAEDISAKFLAFNNAEFTKIKTNKQLLLELNRPEKFSNCSTNDPTKAELFLAEGDSAKSDQGRDSEFQAIYALSGKPFNAKDGNDLSIQKMKNNKIIQDIIKLIGIIPGSNDLSKLNYHKVFVMADADAHGYHISNIIINNLYTLCPKFIENGHLYVVIPPLYGLRIKSTNKLIFVKNSFELISVLAEYVYYKMIDINIKFIHDGKGTLYKKLSKEEFIAFVHIVFELGILLENVSNQVQIHPIILEQLCALTGMFNDLQNPKTLELFKKAFKADMISYNKLNNIIRISIGFEDIVIPLSALNKIIYETLLPEMNKFHYNEMELKMTSKYSNVFKNKTTSISQLYQMFTDAEKHFFKIERYKGLSSMSVPDKYASCINIESRNAFQIHSIGDVERIYQIMGSNSKWRKDFLK